MALNPAGNYIKSFTYGGAYYYDNSYCGTSDDMIYMATNDNSMLYCTSASSGTNITFFPNTPQQIVTTATGAYDIFNFKINFNLSTPLTPPYSHSPLLRIYPQPCDDFLNISNASGFLAFELLDITGKNILTVHSNSEENITVNIRYVKSGVYFIRARYEGGEKNFKFIKN